MGVNGHAHRYLLTLPATRVFPFFGVKASFGDDSSSWRFTFGRRKCLLESPKCPQMQKKKIRPDFFEPADSLWQRSYFLSSYHVSRGICFKATLCHVHHFTRNMHANIREQKISCSFYSARMKICHRT